MRIKAGVSWNEETGEIKGHTNLSCEEAKMVASAPLRESGIEDIFHLKVSGRDFFYQEILEDKGKEVIRARIGYLVGTSEHQKPDVAEEEVDVLQ